MSGQNIRVGGELERVRFNFFVLSFGVILTTVATKIIQYNFLGRHFFFDSNFILNLMWTNPAFALQNDSFLQTAFLSNAINIFGFTSLIQWSIFFAVILTPVVIIVLRRFEIKRLVDYIWIFASVGVLNIHVFNLSKDVYQFVLFLLICAIITSNTSMLKRVLFSAGLLFVWGIVFRPYFMLVAGYTVMAYFVFIYIGKKRKKNFAWQLIILITGVFLSLLFAMFFMPSEYNFIVFARYGVNIHRHGNYEFATTLIADVFHNPGGNILLFMVNYVINFIRLMIPIELLAHFRAIDILFAFYQIMITVFFIKMFKRVSLNTASDFQMLAFSIFSGFILVSALYQPDFGSWARHLSSTWPIMMIAFFDSKIKAHVSTYVSKESGMQSDKKGIEVGD